MTNEEKAKLILHDHRNDTRWFLLENGISEREALLEMAEWKDQQFKKILYELVNKTQHEIGLYFRDYLQRHNDYSALSEDWIRKRTRESMEENINSLLKEN